MSWPKRNRWIVNRFQVALLGYNLGYLLISIVGVAVVLFLPLVLQMRDPTLSSQERAGVAEDLLLLDSRVWPALFLTFCFFALHSILVSHRIAGPLVRFRTIFERVASGQLHVSAKLRDRDYLHDEAEALGVMLEALQRRESGVQQTFEALREDIDELERQTLDGYGKEVLDRARDRIRVALQRTPTASGERLEDTAPVRVDDLPAALPSSSHAETRTSTSGADEEDGQS